MNHRSDPPRVEHRRPHCALCGRQCIPLADYDAPICLDCDDRMTTVLEVAGAVDSLVPRPATAPPATRPALNLSPTLFDELRGVWPDPERNTA